MPRLIDLSHPIEAGMTTYPGLPAPVLSDHLSRESSRAHYVEGTTFQIGRIEMVANTGTYIDAPFHRYAGGTDIAGLPLESIADLAGVVIRARQAKDRAVEPELFAGRDLVGKAVLIETGWSRHWGSDRYFEGHPFLTSESVFRLRDSGCALVGIDSLNIDDNSAGERVAHSTLLERGIPIVEHLRGLDDLPDEGFRFFAVAAPVRGMGSFPVRAFAICD